MYYSIWWYMVIFSLGLFSMSSHGAEEYRYPDVTEVVFSGRFKQVSVAVHQNSDVVVEGVEKKDNLDFQQINNVLSIRTVYDQNNLISSRIVHGGITNIAIGENASSVVSIGGVDTGTIHNSQSLAEVSLIVPKGINIRLEGSIANAQIGNTSGKLMLDTAGKGKIVVGSVGDVSAKSAGAATIHINKISGDLLVDMTGSGTLIANSGEIRFLNIATTGASKVDVNAVADKATINMIGAGTVRVKQVNRKPEVSVLGSGNIHIGGF